MTAEYLDSHPFLCFQPDLSRAPATLWVLLGEAKSKCQHIANAPLLPELYERVHLVYLAKGVQATTAIEGNTLSEEDVIAIIENRHQALPSQEYMDQEVENMIRACNRLIDMDYSRPLSVDDILEFNSWVLEGLELPEEVIPGAIRQHNVTVSRYRAPSPHHLPELMQSFVRWLNEFPVEMFPGMKMETAILKSVLAHIYLVWIHPFGDGNGRTSRLLEWQILLGAGIPAPACHLLSDHYNATRNRYYIELDRAGKSGGVAGFAHYAVEGFVDGLAKQIAFIQDQQLKVFWTNLVHETIPGKTDTARRRRELALTLSEREAPVPFNEIEDLSPKLARFYVHTTERTVTRDLNWLIDKELARRVKGGYLARWSRVTGMLPHRIS